LPEMYDTKPRVIIMTAAVIRNVAIITAVPATPAARNQPMRI
jgi:hypothetical protein